MPGVEVMVRRDGQPLRRATQRRETQRRGVDYIFVLGNYNFTSYLLRYTSIILVL